MSQQTPFDDKPDSDDDDDQSNLNEASGDGDVSTPSPVVICDGVPPAAGTAQICLRSIS